MVRSLLLALCIAFPALAQPSRYLRDAATQVSWKPWGQETIELAKKSNRPLFVSIGFASSWDCFRLQRETFTNAEVAATLNGAFVPVLVDRFEHPEVAEAFDTIQRALAGTTSVPSSFVLTPALEPLAVIGFAEPKELSAFLATNAGRSREEARVNLVKAHTLGEQGAPGGIDPATLDAVVDSIARSFDPKLPRPMQMAFALRFAERTDNKTVRAVALDALRKLARTPLRDQLGGGFHRAPGVFEKTLADQAVTALAYLDAWQLTGEPLFEEVVRTTLDYVIRDQQRTRGAFLATQDAYSLVPGAEGPEFHNAVFYLWSKKEIEQLAGDAAPKIYAVFGIDAATANLPVLAETPGAELAPVIRKILDQRQKRPEPFRDFTEFAGWNGLFLSALSRAGAVLGEQTYVEAATLAARSLVTQRWNEKTRTLTHSDGVPALAEDYAMLVQGMLDLFDATYDVKWLALAKTLQQRQDELFWNASLGRYTTGHSLPDQLRGLLVESDDVTPSANAVSASNNLRLAMLGDVNRRKTANAIFESFGGRLRNNGADLPQLAASYAMSLASPKIEVVVGEPRKKDTFDLLHSIHQRWEPLRAVVFVPQKGPDRNRILTALPFAAALAADPDRPLAYVCENGECRPR
jgi:uncharacterized protein YyaL (SSP411 family)